MLLRQKEVMVAPFMGSFSCNYRQSHLKEWEALWHHSTASRESSLVLNDSESGKHWPVILYAHICRL